MKRLVSFACLILAACSGGGGGTSSSASSSSGGSNGDPQGIYFGSLNNSLAGTTDQLIVLVTADGHGFSVDTTNPAIFRDTGLSINGDSFSASFKGYAGAGVSFQNGAKTETGTISGSFVPGASISATATANGANNTFQGTYQTGLYEIPASFSTIAGTYTYTVSTSSGSDTVNVAISSSGVLTGSDSFGCSISGSGSVPSPSHNAYELTAAYTCGGTTVNVSGFAVYQPPAGGNPAQLYVEYDDGNTTAIFAIANKTG